MQTLRLRAELLPSFLEALKLEGTLWAPVDRGSGTYALEAIEDVRAARPEALRTILPFKKLLLPPKLTMLRKDPGGAVREAEPKGPAAGKNILFGSHACDLHALKILDMLHLRECPDPYYAEARRRLTVVGYGCMPDDKCFCKSLGTGNAADGFDLFLTPLEGRHLLTVGSARGDDIVRRNPKLFSPSTRQDTAEYLERLRVREAAFTLSLEVDDLPYILELKKDDPVWDELGKKCLCCGSCSMVCPTCACFNMVDEIPEEGHAERVRCWDSCLFRDYAVCAGGHNFRSSRADRVRNRYYHKQEAFVREYGMPSCVGCGRCIENCPTGIHVVQVFKMVRGESC